MSHDSHTMPGSSAVATVPVLEAEHLTKHFKARGARLFAKRSVVHAVEDVSLRLYQGHVTALVGESGSGKTTVARMLARMYPATSGAIRLRGSSVTNLAMAQRRAYFRQVQLIFQDPFGSLNGVHTVRYILSRPLRIHGHARTEDEVTELASALLRRVSLTPPEQFLEKYPHELSGGQRQRVAIARALAVRPSVLLADEPISMLDVSIRLGVLNLLRELKEQEHLALLYITHDIASARYFAEDTLVMYAGQMVEGGPSEDVTQSPAHPYTQVLLAAAPDPEHFGPAGSVVKRAMPARGEPPSLINPPTGCRFHPRCPFAMDVCRERFPDRTDLGNGHWAHCWLLDQGSPHASAVGATNTIKATKATTATEGQGVGQP